MPANGGQIDNLGAFQRHILGCADLDVLRIRLVALSEAAIIEIESDPILHADRGSSVDASVDASISLNVSGHVVRCSHLSGLMMRLV